jgi:hypothetical protein
VLGDLKVKVKDIINEGPGFISSYVTGLLPKSLADVADIPLRGRIDGQMSDKEKQEKADQMFAPGGEKDWGDDSSTKEKSNIITPDNLDSAADEPRKPSKQSAPRQVRLPSGQIVSKRDGHWYDEDGDKIVIPGDIERLERMARGPSGQSQMASTKHAQVDLPGYKRKKK